MFPRGRIDSSLVFLLKHYANSFHSVTTPPNIYGEQSRYFLCVRSAWLCLLEYYNVKQGDAVLMSACTIPDMKLIVEDFGATAIGIDLASPQAFPKLSDCQAAYHRAQEQGLNVRLCICAQLFGSRHSLTEIGIWCQQQQLPLIEDIAQLPPKAWRPQAYASCSLASFGTIKSPCAAGGALCISKDKNLLNNLEQIYKQWPIQKAADFRGRVLRCAIIYLMCLPFIYNICWLLRDLLRIDHDEFLARSVRGFSSAFDRTKFTRQAHPALQHCIYNAIKAANRTQDFIQERDVVEELFSDCLLGAGGEHHQLWLLAIYHKHVEQARITLREHGFDSAQQGNLCIVDKEHCTNATDLLDHMLVLPHPSIYKKSKHLMRMHHLLQQHQ